MALVLADRVQQTGTANTTVSFTLSGSVTGYQSFAVVGNGNTTYYAATDGSVNWEVGIGTYSTTGPTLTRTTVVASSNSGSAVTFSGTVNVFVTYPSEKSVNLDGSGNVSALGTVSSGVWQGTAVAVGYGGTGVTTSTGSGSNVLSTSPTLVTPILGTPTSVTLTNATGLSLSTGVTGTLLEANGGTGTTTGYYGFKNRIINGAMVIDQRNAGASQSYGSTGSTYCLDRFFLGNSQTGKVTSQQNAGSVTPPAGFQNYLGVTVAAAITPSASDTFYLSQAIEGCNLLDLNWGTANAQSITISAWVRSSATGTFGGSVINSGAISPRRTYCFTYNIPVANTWTYITVTIPGDTTGTWYQIGNGVGMYVVFSYGVGSTNSTTSGSFQNGSQISATGAVSIMGTLGATFYITGVQLEKNSTATSFDYRPYGTELVLCQRYFVKTYGQSVAVPTNSSGGFVRTRSYSGSYGAFVWLLPVTMRTAPTATIYNQSTSAVNSWWNVDASTSATADVSTTGEQSITVESSGLSTNNTYEFQLTGSAEL